MYQYGGKSKLNFSMVSHLQFRFQTLAVYTVLLPLLSFIFCVIYSLLFNFERATFTHCHVPNYLPSISAAIGSFTPQRYIWQLCVAIHSAPRFLVVCLYYSHLCDLIYNEGLWQWLVSVIFVLQVTEVLSLLGLTFVSSSENFFIHELCFISFMVCALSNMLLLYLVMKYGRKQKLTSFEMLSLKFKSICGLINISSFFLAVYFYYRHNWYCEPVIYTFFALFEYVVVISNMGYHMTAYYDFSDHVVSVTSCFSVSIATKSLPKYSVDDFVIKIA